VASVSGYFIYAVSWLKRSSYFDVEGDLLSFTYSAEVSDIKDGFPGGLIVN
jgi:hypothetical protein